MPYVEWWGSILGHMKTLDLIDLLSIPRYAAVGIRACIYAFAIEYHPGGYFPESLIPRACGWKGDAQKLLSALRVATLIEDTDTPGIVKIHDWEEYTKNYRKSKVDAKRTLARYRRLAGLPTNEDDAVEGKEPAKKGDATELEDELLQLARDAVCPNSPDVLRSHIKALIARADVGPDRLRTYLGSQEAKGKTIVDWQQFFKSKNGPSVPFSKGKTKPPNPDCKHCGGRGRRLNPMTQTDMDCVCVSAHTGHG